MKKTCIALIILMLSTGATAHINNGPYVSIRAGVGNASTEVSGYEDPKQSDTDFLYSFAIGARTRSIRVEGEVTLSSKIKYMSASYLKQRYMLQLYYDVPLNSIIRPYFNVGAGLNYTDVSINANKRKNKDNGTSFSWNAGAGLSVSVSSALNFDIGYRYVDAGKESFFNLPEIHMTSHEGYMGIRYTF